MRVLFIYRNPQMGISIGKTWRGIQQRMEQFVELDALYMPAMGYHPKALWHNIQATRQALKDKQYDIIHITGTENYLLPFLRRYNTVVTVHDLGFLSITRKTTFNTLGKILFFVKTIKYAKRVAFISKKTEEETFKYITLRKGQYTVIPEPITSEFHYAPKIINTDCPTILHIGTLARKNLRNTLIALQDFPHRLRVIGKVDDTLRTQLDAGKWPYTCAQGLTDEEIVQEYEQCDIVNFPSLYEGFGMPILEGQAVGRPVVTSQIAPMDEVAGEGAVLVDPHDPQSILNGYKEALATWPTLVQKGLENVRHYQIAHIAEQYLALYKELNA